ncbi:MAG: hypothetical protein MJZ38_03390 [archaeon]|nr:hypothetical protein [archaeon]
MSDSNKFCTQCGCNVGPQMQFCPQCGKAIEGSEAFANQAEFTSDMQTVVKESQRNFLTLAILVYALPAIVAGIIALVDASATASTIWNNVDFQSYYHNHGWHFTRGDLQNYITYIGAMELASGICAAGCVVCILKRINHMVAFILCLVAAFLCIWSIFGMLIGIMMAWSVFGAKELFENEEAKTE